VAALTGMWMALFFSGVPGDGPLLVGIRLVVGSLMVASLVLGFIAVRRRDFRRHSAWMMRGYAVGLGAGTQVLTTLPWVILVGPAVGTTRALLLAAGWVVNLAVAEWVIRRRPAAGPNRASAIPATA
jgi:hypothetical protein